MESSIKRAKDLVKHNLVKQISNVLFEVEEHSIKLQKKKGRIIILCDCENSGMFADNNFCIHKTAVITYLANKDFIQRLQKLTEQYKGFKENKLNPSIDMFIDDLNSIKEKW